MLEHKDLTTFGIPHFRIVPENTPCIYPFQNFAKTLFPISFGYYSRRRMKAYLLRVGDG